MARYDIATRAQVLALKCVGTQNYTIQQYTGIPSWAINRIIDRAIKRGFDLTAKPSVILNHHVEDAPRSGRRPINSAYKVPNPTPRRFADPGQSQSVAPLRYTPPNGQSPISHEERLNGTVDDEGLGESIAEENQSQDSLAQEELLDTSTPATGSAQFAPTRCLQAQKLMLPIFGDTIDLSKLVLVIHAGDSLIRHDATDFLKNQLPLWDGIWCQQNLPSPVCGDSIIAKFVKISQCITMLDRRSRMDDLRLRCHRVLQYQFYLGFKEEVTKADAKKDPSQTNASVAVDRLLNHLYPDNWANVDEEERERRKQGLLSQKRAGKRLQTLCDHFGYGILLLGSRKAVNRMKVSRSRIHLRHKVANSL